jgi:hypothetical protein
MKEPIIAENALQNVVCPDDFTFILSPAAADRLLSDTNLQDPEILRGRVCRIAAIWRVQFMEFWVILGYIQKINFHCLTREHCGECSGVLR